MTSRTRIIIDAQDKTKVAFRAAESRLKSLSRSVFSLKGAFGALGGTLVLKSILDATIEQEAAFRQVQQAIVSTGGAAGLSAKEIEKMAAGFQKVTTFSDEAILRVQSKILTFTGITKKTFGATTEAVLDLATRMQGDLNGAVVQLGKVLNDPIANLGSLSRVGIQFTETDKAMIKQLAKSGDLLGAQSIILKELNKEFGGSARAARDTFGGALKSLGNAFGDLLEAKSGLPAAQTRLENLTKLLQDPKTVASADKFTSNLIFGFTKLVGLIPRAADALNRFLTAGDRSKLNHQLRGYLEGIVELRGAITRAQQRGDEQNVRDAKALLAKFQAKVRILQQQLRALDLPAALPPAISGKGNATAAKAAAVTRTAAAAAATATKAQAKLNAERAKAQKILGALATPEEREIAALQKIADLGPAAFGGEEEYNTAINRTIAGFEKLDAKMKAIPPETKKANDAARELGITFSSAFENAIVGGNKFSDVLRGLGQDILRIFARKAITEPLASGFSNLFSGFNFGSLFGFAGGGQPPVGVPSIVGERGPELFVPRTAGTIIPNHQLGGGGSSVTINQSITVNGNGDAALAQAVEVAAQRGAQQGYAMVNSDLRRNGPLRAALA